MVRNPAATALEIAVDVRPEPQAADCLRRWVKQLRRQRYAPEAIHQVFGVRSADELGAAEREVWGTRLAERTDPLSVWLQLFWLELPVRHELVAGHAGQLLDSGLKAGLFQRCGRSVRASLRAEPVRGAIVWADHRFEDAARRGILRQRGGPVYPPSADSLMLAEIVPHFATGRMLDLCTGSGVLALIVARGRNKVVGVDIDPRAVEAAQLNAEANGLKSARFLLGDLYAPVASERFHCIVANPPFVCSPYANGPRYHSGGPLGDQVLRRIVAGFGPHLHRGGKALAISHVGLRQGESLVDRARAWLSNFDGRCLVVEFARADAASFVAQQATFALAEGIASFRREFRRWLQFLRRHRVHDIAAVLVAVERTGTNFIEVVSAKPVVVPVPLNKSATQVVREWWTH